VLPVGRALSSSTMPGLLARIIEASELQPGMRALQIGTGPGYMAALISHLVMECGTVVTIEIDPEIAAAARSRLSSFAYRSLHCVSGDGYLGYPPMAPYDRIVVTASCADVPATWIGQLSERGLIVLPLSLSQRASLYPMVAFRKVPNGLRGKVASSLIGVGFIPLYGQNIKYPVLYQESISKIESAVYRALQRGTYRRNEYEAIALIVLLEIARAVEENAGRIESTDPKALRGQSIDLWNQLGKPKVEDFSFHLVPEDQPIENHTWRFRKDHYAMFVTTRPQA
jgi:protein-L-isoaspartate(D-aspartate) O-methyltransferase